MPINESMRGRPCGRKRQFVVDTQGRLWVADVHAANQAEGPAAIFSIGNILWRAGERLEKVYGDQSYNGVFAKALADWDITFEKASRPPWRGQNRLEDLSPLLNRTGGPAG